MRLTYHEIDENSNLAWLSSTCLLYINGAKFVARPSCIALFSKRCRKASDITTINAKPIRPEFFQNTHAIVKNKVIGT